MNKLIYGLTFTLTSCLPAQAKDGAVELPNWTEFYVGIGAAQNATTNVVDSYIINGQSDRGPTAHDFSGFGYAGYRKQMNNFVLGLEGEFDIGGKVTFRTRFANSADTFADIVCGTAPTICADAGTFGSFDQQGRARAIAGYAVDSKVMIYAAGGLSMGQAYFEGTWASASDGGAVRARFNSLAPTNKTLYGYNIGAGAELKITDHTSLRGEVIYDNYGKMGVPFGGVAEIVGGSSASISTNSAGYNSLSARASISFNF